MFNFFKRGPLVDKRMLTRSRPPGVASNTAAAVAASNIAVDAAVAALNIAVAAVAPPLSHCGPNQQSSAAESNNPLLRTAPVNA